MDEIARYRRHFAHADFASRALFGALRAMKNPPPAASRALAHVLAAEVLWLDRLHERAQSLPVWPELDLAGSERVLDRLAPAWPEYLESRGRTDLDRAISYVNSKGEPYSSVARDILDHVLLHGAHHRGQVVHLLRAAGVEPPYIDYIHAVRQNFI